VNPPVDIAYVASAALLAGLAVYGVLVAEQPLRKLLALNLLGSALFLLLVLLARRDGSGALDAVPQALVLTGMVVAVATTALALALMLALQRRRGSAAIDDRDGDDDGDHDPAPADPGESGPDDAGAR
jgi:multicomponent Na+:H+ antiporter subunit C